MQSQLNFKNMFMLHIMVPGMLDWGGLNWG